MTDEATAGERRYSAFISYSHQDAPFARRLQRRLETYRLPRRLAARVPGQSRRLKPVFRDRVSQRAAPNIIEVIRQALAASDHLIVVCSPAAAASTWVNREVRLFHELSANGTVLAALASGEPPEVFPAALRGDEAAGEPLAPLAADFRRKGDGGRLALLKLVAVLADVELEDLAQRDAQRRVRQVTAISAGALMGMALASFLAAAALTARAAAERERDRGERTVELLLTDLRKRLQGVGRLDLLAAVNQVALRYYQGQDLAHLPPVELRQRAVLLEDIGQDEIARGHYAAALAQFSEARRATRTLLAAQPGDPARIFDQSQAEFYVGLAKWRLGDDAGAEAGFRAYADLARRLIRAAPDNPTWLEEAGNADSNLGTFVLRASADTTQAAALFQSSLADYEAAARREPANRELQDNIADGYGWLGSVERLRGRLDRALAYHTLKRQALLRLAAVDPRDDETKTELISVDLSLARDAADRRDFKNAIAQFQRGREAAVLMARDDPENAAKAAKVRAFELFEVRAWLETPPALRPPATKVRALLGDCAADRAGPNDEELARFCSILQSRLARQEGRGTNGPSRSARTAGAIAGPVLSQNYLINFAAEAKRP